MSVTEKDTKTHQQRRLTLDPETVAVLTEHWERCQERAAAVGEELAARRVRVLAGAGRRDAARPSSVSQRYSRLAARLGIETHLHCLRHYSATELIAAGVDVRTVAGRLGHSGGGTTTLRVYAAWHAEADQRAAAGLAGRAPSRPRKSPAERVLRTRERPASCSPSSCESRSSLAHYPVGTDLPGVKAMAAERGVSPSTVQRAYRCSGNGAWSRWPPASEPMSSPRQRRRRKLIVGVGRLLPNRHSMIRLDIRKAGRSIAKLMAAADPTDPAVLRQLLMNAVRRAGDDDAAVGSYEMPCLMRPAR